MGIETVPAEKAKKEKYLELFHGEPDAIVVFSSDIVGTSKDMADFGIRKFGNAARVSGNFSEWRSTAFSDLDPHGGICGGSFPIHAASKAAKIFPDVPVVTTTRDRDVDADKGRPSHARVLAEEIKRRGVAQERIILEEESVNTKTQIKELLLLAVKNKWKRVAVITNNFRISRSKSMLEAIRNSENKDPLEIRKDSELKGILDKLKDIDITFVSDEDILVGAEKSTWETVFDRMKQTPEYKKRLAMEMQGVKDLKEGTYGKK